jgi:prepilin-type N-terminal cleavage/methylation domain-containing protein
MKKRINQKGFTLIELLLVVVIIGILLSVIVPRAWRANIDAKYGLVRQNCSELASFGSLWAEQQIEASVEYRSTAGMYNYLRTLTYSTSDTGGQAINWIGTEDGSNWNNRTSPLINITGRVQGNTFTVPPENSVEAIVPVEKIPRNPFNGVSVFSAANDPITAGTALPGAIACGWQIDDSRVGDWAYFAFIFQGTDNTTTDPTDSDSYLAGQDASLEGLRNGIFFARTPYYDAPTDPGP